MKLGKAPELMKKAAAVLKSKTGVVLGARILVLASFRRRMAAVGAISHRMHVLVVAAAADREKAGRAGVDCHRALVVVPRRATVAAAMGEKPAAVTADISRQLALFDQADGGDGGGCHDWTHALFNDDGDCCYAAGDGDGHDDDRVVPLDDDEDDEPPVMEVIRSNREVEGLEFNMDDEIDQAADMFIRRFRERMNRSF